MNRLSEARGKRKHYTASVDTCLLSNYYWSRLSYSLLLGCHCRKVRKGKVEGLKHAIPIIYFILCRCCLSTAPLPSPSLHLCFQAVFVHAYLWRKSRRRSALACNIRPNFFLTFWHYMRSRDISEGAKVDVGQGTCVIDLCIMFFRQLNNCWRWSYRWKHKDTIFWGDSNKGCGMS